MGMLIIGHKAMLEEVLNAQHHTIMEATKKISEKPFTLKELHHITSNLAATKVLG